MSTSWVAIVALMATSAPNAGFAQEFAQEGAAGATAASIREIISGKTCVGDDVLRFGKSVPGSPALFERVGRPAGTYAIGYGTILIRRGQELHSHVTTVSVEDHRLYMSAGSYRCAP